MNVPPRNGAWDSRAWDTRDLLTALLLFAVLLLYFAVRPHNLGESDESYFLRHTVRILEGQVPYRDFDEQYTPFGYYLMALPFWLFGTSIAAAKLAMGVFHAGTVLLLYAAARSLSVGRGLAVATALLHIALCETAWPMASGHWIATFFIALILCCACRPLRGRRELLWLGIATGGLIATQHQKGVPIAVGVAAIVAVVWRLEGGFDRCREFRQLREMLAAYSIGVLAVAVPFLAAICWLSGVEPLIDQLVIQPFTGYRRINEASWGEVEPLTRGLASNTIPVVLEFLPLLILIATVRGIAAWRRRGYREVRVLSTLSIYCGFSALSVLYRPDFIHIAFIAAPFFVFLAETLQWGIAAAARLGGLPGWARPLEWGLAALLVVLVSLHLEGHVERSRVKYPHSAQTRFGQIDFAHEGDPALVAAVLAEMQALPERELFGYPAFASMYLMAEAENPTPFDLVFRGLHTPEQFEQIIGVLEERRMRNVVVRGFTTEGDPILRYLALNYECIHPPAARKSRKKRACALYRRRAADSR